MTRYLLDTMVISDPIKSARRRNPAVAAWISAQDLASLFLSSVTIAEIGAGLETMESGLSRDRYERWCAALVEEEFRDRILPFDLDAALTYRYVAAAVPRSGWQKHARDLQIAAIGLLHGMTIVTRNVRDFASCGVETVDPWNAG